jgi:beta-glucanase (GH16 family)
MFCQVLCDYFVASPIQNYYICDDNPWVLVFEDDFNGNELDQKNWSPITGVPRDVEFTSQKAWHKPENIEIENGVLKIISKEELLNNMPVVISWDPLIIIYENFNYSTGEIWSKYNFGYGAFEARIKIPKGKGFWPAFWTYGENPTHNEVDIFEFWNESDIWNNYDPSKLAKVHNMTVHHRYYAYPESKMCHTDYAANDFSQDFHIFTVIWDFDKLQWFVDGDLKRTDYLWYFINGQTIGCLLEAFHEYKFNTIYPLGAMAIVLNVAIQYGYDEYGNNREPDESTPFPSQMEVDWVKYYQRKPCQNINIIDAAQYPLSDEDFNVIVGEDVTINCNYEVQSGQQLRIIAKNSIKLLNGFKVEPSSSFTTKLDATLCNSNSLNSLLVEENDDSTYKDTQLEKILSTSASSSVNIFPNPSNGNFTIDFGNKDYKNYMLMIFDISNRLMYSNEKINEKILHLNPNFLSKGIYFLNLINIETNETITKKLIIQ